MTELFVSYCRDDTALVEPIVENFRQLGFDLWIDIEHLPPGTPAWTQAIDEALQRADGVLAFLSPAAKESEWCNIETERAKDYRKSVYPILLAGDKTIAVPIHLTRVQFSDMRESADREYSFRQLVETLSKDLSYLLPEFELKLDRDNIPRIIIPDSGHEEGDYYDLKEAGEESPVGRASLHKEPPKFKTRWFVAALIIVGIVIGVVLGLRELSNNLASKTTPTQLPVADAVEPTEPISTQEPTITPSLMSTPSPMSTPSATTTPSPTIPPDIVETANRDVVHNDDWEPYRKTINGTEMALVPKGCFRMGSDYGHNDEAPAHTVCFDAPFWIDVYEVTNARYGERASGTDSAGNICVSLADDDEQPRICVNWSDARDYCESRGARLPTEAEWEYAARGPDNLIYPWGNDFLADNVVYGVSAVGSNQGGVSWVGAFDLSGNVWEWVNDWYGSLYYRTLDKSVDDPQGPDEGQSRVVRGGAWYNEADYVRATNRDSSDPDITNYGYGFRCAASFEP
ncbi:MAG: SUMF1/EgtB/PvdO family nonheme iron enzyme [Anaerolineae bacterium]|nr:SUMF1/EgtB/PvdO family nonheme iron enzyme [Anaerolineae bacterium]